jgi:ribonuclease HII
MTTLPPGPVAGIDEVGRGCLSGPVVAAAVVLPQGWSLAGLADSKAVPEGRRRALDTLVREACAFGIGSASVEEIERLNILRATFLAMRRALAALPARPVHVLVDGNRLPPGLGVPATCVVGGDATVPAISAASIVAKVHRDALMAELAAANPGYGWEANAGYGTPAHLDAIRRLGPTEHHRATFRGVREWLVPAQGTLSLG